MNIKSAFIPCAGLGTRMGEVGKVIPKPLWPLFDGTLLEAQISYGKHSGCTDFYINVFHCRDIFKEYLEDSQLPVEALFEDPLLGNGGSFHNLKQKNSSLTEVLVLNPDSFLLLDDRDWRAFFKMAKEFSNVLIGVPCEKEDSYNRISFNEESRFQGIIPPSPSAPEFTYSGFSKISLNSFPHVSGMSSFFETVVNPTLNQTGVFIPEFKYEFWDFGTLDLYKSSIQNVLELPSSKLYVLLITAGFLDPKKVGPHSYGSNVRNIFNFTGQALPNEAQKESGFYLKAPGEGGKIFHLPL